MSEERNTFAKTVVIGLAVIAIGVAAIVWGVVALNKIDRTVNETSYTVTNGEFTETESEVTTTATTDDISETEVYTITVPAYVSDMRAYSRFTGEYLNFLNNIVFEKDLNQRAINNEELTPEEETTYELWRLKTREVILLNEFLRQKGGGQ